MPEHDDRDRTTEARRILDRVSKEADSSGFAWMPSRRGPQRPGSAEPLDGDDPLDAWASRVGRTIGMAVTVGLLLWLVLYATGRV